LVLVVLEFRLNPALSERAATGWRAETLSRDAIAGRGPSRHRVNKPGPTGEGIDSLFKICFGCWEFVAVAGYPYVQSWQQENTQEQSTQEAADDNNCEGTLRIRTDAA
jgi:hypothetical protein